jgi:uncharacterized protein YqeY
MTNPSSPQLKAKIRTDLTASMKARNTTRTGTLRMALAAIGTAEVAGEVAKELSDTEVIAVLTREVRKRNEAAELYAGAGRQELVDQELAEAEVLGEYLPAALSDDELDSLVTASLAEVEASTGAAPTMRQMGLVIKTAQAKAAGRADGSRIAAAVRAALA